MRVFHQSSTNALAAQLGQEVADLLLDGGIVASKLAFTRSAMSASPVPALISRTTAVARRVEREHFLGARFEQHAAENF
jgi:hypothetical protein